MLEVYSNITLLGFLFTLTMGALLILLPRRFAVLPLLMTACYITLGQAVIIASLHFTIIRIIIFFGLVRILIRGEAKSFELNNLDKIITLYVISSVLAYYFLRLNSEAIVNQLGFAYNAMGLYFILRFLIRDMDDIQRILKMLAVVMVPLACAMLIEKTIGRNVFSIFGGVPEFTMVREGRLRCQGAFSHPILAGTFGVTCIPFFIALWVKDNKVAAALGLISAAIIALTPTSSGPLMTLAAICIGLYLWRFRENIRLIIWAFFILLIGLHMVMKAPVWALIGKASEIVGGGGWHRVMLINAAIDHFNEWWFLGTDYTRHWMPTGVSWSDKHADITNQFIGVGIEGGLLSLLLFTTIIIYSFVIIGRKLNKMKHTENQIKFTVWCLGVSLFAHVTSFFSIRYFDQIILFWYLILSFIATFATITVNTDA